MVGKNETFPEYGIKIIFIVPDKDFFFGEGGRGWGGGGGA